MSAFAAATPALVPTVDEILAALDEVADPEIPNVSIVQLGMIGNIEADADAIRVELLPTFVGCPALEVIRGAVVDGLASFGRPVEVEVSFSTPWTSDRITAAGREALRRSGFAPPPTIAAAPPRPAERPTPCPYCGSRRTTLVTWFGPTQCRSIHHCADCRQPFEGFKPV